MSTESTRPFPNPAATTYHYPASPESVQAARRAAGRARVVVVGTSYGGFVAYALARATVPNRVGRVVISNSDLLKTAATRRSSSAPAPWFAGTADLFMALDTRGAQRLEELSFYRRRGITLLPGFKITKAMQVITDSKRFLLELAL